MAAEPPADTAAVTPAALLAALADGVTVLTATERAARSLREAFHQRRLDENAGTFWSSPAILPLERWLETCFHTLTVDGHETRLLLNAAQEHAVWSDTIAADSMLAAAGQAAKRLPGPLAELATEAWRQLALAGALDRLNECLVSRDGKAFVRWAQEFDRRCRRQHLLPAAALPELLTAAHAAGLLKLPAAGLLLVDFDHLQPAHARLFDAIKHSGIPLRRVAVAVPRQSARLCTAQDEADELNRGAGWITEMLSERPAAGPAVRLAVVVPALAARRPALERAFAVRLPPGTTVEFSLGIPLAQTAFGATALDLLGWLLGPLPVATVSALLLSPFFCTGTGAGVTGPEWHAVATFDAFRLRGETLLQPELSLDDVIALLERSARRQPRLYELLNRARQLRDFADNGSHETHATWAERFRAALEAAGCTRAVAADAEGVQLLRRWESTLDQLATLDFDGSQPTAAEALATLTRLARQTIFAPESGGATVQVLGPLEVGAVAFDALWFLGADDLAWPPGARPAALLPWRLQRDLHLRGADHTLDRAIAQNLTQRIAAAAPHIVFSFALHDEETARRAAPLLAALALTPYGSPLPPAFARQPSLRVRDDLPVPHLPPVQVSGGARVLELQSACGFRAFAEMRLASTAIESRSLGLDARERGILVHSAMEHFWTQVQDQAALKSMPSAERDAILQGAVAEAFASTRQLAQTAWDDAYLDLQQQRLIDLLRPWLAFEQTRPPFAILRQETTLAPAQIGRLTLKSLRVDRIDETEGGLLLLDYKTGIASPTAWRGERPEQPQLPLYAAILTSMAKESSEPLAGVAFAMLRPGREMALQGVSDDTRVLVDPKRMDEPTFLEQVAEWQRLLGLLADAFLTGDARVNPRRYPGTCQHCGQRTLCRLDPKLLVADEEGGSDGEDRDAEDHDAAADDLDSEFADG